MFNWGPFKPKSPESGEPFPKDDVKQEDEEVKSRPRQLVTSLTIACKERTLNFIYKGHIHKSPEWRKFLRWFFAQPCKPYFVLVCDTAEYLISRDEIKWYTVVRKMEQCER